MPLRVGEPESIRLSQAVSDCVKRIGGVVDFWTLMPFMTGQVDAPGFIEAQGPKLTASVTVLHDLLVANRALEADSVEQAFHRLSAATDQMAPTIAVLLQFQTLSPEAIQQATHELREAHDTALAQAQCLCDLLHLSPEVFGPGWTDLEMRQRAILDRLDDLFAHERASRESVSGSPIR